MTHSRAVVVALFLGLGPVAVQAQGLTVKGGLSYGDVSNRGLLPGALDVRTGFAAGLSLSPSGSNLLGLGVDALYAQRRLDSGASQDSRDLRTQVLPSRERPILSPTLLQAGGLTPSEQRTCNGAPAQESQHHPAGNHCGKLQARCDARLDGVWFENTHLSEHYIVEGVCLQSS